MQIPGFELIEKLGEGGMATVWKARQISLDRTVAIKVLAARLSRDPADAARFQSEAQSMASLKHPGIVQVYDVSTHEGLHYIVMEYVAGYSVGDWIRRKTVLSESDALLTAEHVAIALNHAWTTQSMTHCDIKPDNVMIDSDGTIKVTDLGLARTLAGQKGADTAEVMGTPNYMSPEQVTGASDLDCRSDIYALGAMIYHMVTGKTPFEEDDPDTIMRKQVSDTLPDPIDINPKLTIGVCWLIEKMMAKNPAQRQQTWKETLSDIVKVKRTGLMAGHEMPPGSSTVMRSERRVVPVGRYRTALAEDEKKGIPVAVWIGLSAVAVAAAILLLVKPRPAQSGRHAAPPHRPPPRTPAVNPAHEERAAAAFQSALAWANANPSSYDEALRRFLQVAQDAKGTKFSSLAIAEVERTRTARRAAVQDVMDKLKRDAESFLPGRQYEKAAAIYTDYAGPFAAEIEEFKRNGANEMRRQAAGYEAEKARKAAEAGLKIEKILNGIASTLLNCDVPAARRAIEQEAADSDVASNADIAAIRRLLAETEALETTVMRSFKDHEGRMATLETVSGNMTLKVLSVDQSVIKGEETVSKGSYTIVRAVEIPFAQIAPTEFLRRLGTREDQSAVLERGILALKAQAYDSAKQYFSHLLPQTLADRLLMGMSDARSAKADAAAAAALARLAKSLALDVGDYNQRAYLAAIENTFLTNFPPQIVKAAVEGFRGEYGASDFGKQADVVLTAILAKSQKDAKTAVTVAAENIDIPAILKTLTVANRELAESDIEIEKSSRFPGYVLRVRSQKLASLGGLKACSQGIAELDISQSMVRDVSPVSGAQILALNVADTKVTSMPPLMSGMALESLNISGTQIRDINFLARLKLRELDLSRTRIMDYRVFERCGIENLTVSSGCFKDKDLGMLSRLPLKVLRLRDTQITTLAPLKNLALESLDIGENKPLKDLTPLTGHPIRWLSIDGSGVTDLSPLRGMPLDYLNAGDTALSDLQPLKAMSLKHLRIHKTAVQSIAMLEDVPLHSLNISDTRVSDLGPIRNCKTLKEIYFTRTGVSDLSPLKDLRLTCVSCVGIVPNSWLPLHGQPITDLFMDIDESRGQQELIRSLPSLQRLNGRPVFPRGGRR